MKKWIENKKESIQGWLAIAFIMLALGIVGEMEYQDQLAALNCDSTQVEN